ncbi:hypothetical protein IWQ60_008513 [Tieghemiomyces parasiticus]|uniref:MHD domain-containing protein n=1 Tax=Tieghemiomyces parasiticus TaxID=78921 RepID=A0A9W8DRV9_9FUNG|nr:hypothetical protein IWQ60_008513 [Tieghemiomyces parasiticus]
MVYADAFINEHPQLTYNALSNRIRKAAILNTDLADYFRERTILEENHVKQLQKLHRKAFISDPSSLGQLQPLWVALFDEIQYSISLHSELALQIGQQVERPLRDYVVEDEAWVHLKKVQANLAETVRTFSEKDNKIAKYKKTVEARKSSRKAQTASQKLNDTAVAFEDSKRSWRENVRPALDHYEQVDRARLTLIKDLVARYEDLILHTCHQKGQQAETVKALARQVDVEQDLQQVCQDKKALAACTPGRTPIRDNHLFALPRRTSVKSKEESPLSSAMPLPQARSPRSDSATESTASPFQSSPLASQPSRSNASTPRESALDLSRSIGSTHHHPAPVPTVAKRRTPPPPPVPLQTGAVMGIQPPTGDTSVPSLRPTTAAIPAAALELAFGEEGSPMMAAAVISPVVCPESALAGPPAAISEARPSTNDADTQPRSPGPRQPPLIPNTDNFYSDDSDNESLGANRVKFNIKTEAFKESSEQAAKALSRVTGTLRSTPSVRRRGRRGEIPGGGTSVYGALPATAADMASTPNLPSTRSVNTPAIPGRSPGHLPRSNMASTVSLPHSAPSATLSLSNLSLSPSPSIVPSLDNNFFAAFDNFGPGGAPLSPTPSMGHTVTQGGGSGSMKFIREESLHVRSTAGGSSVDKVIITGEVKLALHQLTGRDLIRQGPLPVRLTNLDALESFVVNPRYMTAVTPAADGGNDDRDSARSDLYHLRLDSLTPPTAPDHPINCTVVLLKYQEIIPTSAHLDVVPILVQAQWRCQGDQASLIVSYEPNPRFRAVSAPVNLQQVSVAVTIKGGAKHIVSRPEGTWNAEKQRLTWPVGDLVVNHGGHTSAFPTPAAEACKLLLRALTTLPVAQPAPVTVQFVAPQTTLSRVRFTLELSTPTDRPSALPWAVVDPVQICRSGKYVCAPPSLSSSSSTPAGTGTTSAPALRPKPSFSALAGLPAPTADAPPPPPPVTVSPKPANAGAAAVVSAPRIVDLVATVEEEEEEEEEEKKEQEGEKIMDGDGASEQDEPVEKLSEGEKEEGEKSEAATDESTVDAADAGGEPVPKVAVNGAGPDPSTSAKPVSAE